MRMHRFRSWIMAVALVASAAAQAADTDLFAGPPPDPSAAPQVLFVIDTGASFSASNSAFRCNITSSGAVKTDGTGAAADFTNLDRTNGGVEQCALFSVVKSLAVSTTTVNIGVMFFNSGMKTFDPASNAFGSECSSGTGGCLAMKILSLNSTTAPRVLDWVRNWTTSGNGNYNIKAPANRGDGATMQEAWAYFFGKTGVSGRDYSAITPLAGCSSKNIIFIGNNWSTQASPKDGTNESSSPLKPLNGTSATPGKRANPAATPLQLTSIQDTLSTVCGAGTLDTSEGKGAYALNWTRYMKAQGVTTYSVGLMNAGCDAYYGAFLEKMGSSEIGGGKFFSTNSYDELVTALKTALGEIQSVNSVFAAVSLPVSVNSQGSYLNQVYVGMFRPASNFLPRWNGNLKQYKLGLVAGEIQLQDADAKSAINGLTGFITECARSYWTPLAVDDYWGLDPSGGCLTINGANASNSPDGNIVEKGAQAYDLRALVPASRTMKTCSPVFANCIALTDFTVANTDITQSLLNPSGTDRAALINWARGANLDNELSKGTAAMRPSVHGDVVHSRPVPLNHGTDAAPSIVVYYGGNDGVLRAVNGNRGSADPTSGRITSGGNSYNAGDELWSFMPPQFYGSIKRLRDNTQPISYPGTPSPTATAKSYGIDGPITAFQGQVAGAAKSFVYATMRRGGRAIYAFDVTTPGNPALLWKNGCPNQGDDTGCSTDYTGMGQSWSSMKALFAAGYSGGAAPLMITGGGYDPCEDYDALTAGGANHNCTSATKGNKVYVIDAATGVRVKAFDTDRAVIADSTLVRDTTTGNIKYAYTADLGGNVYRMTFGIGAPSTWTIQKIASLGCDSLAPCTANRKFMFAPSVATVDNATYFILLGSGDREKPLSYYAAAKAVSNHFFMVKDVPGDSQWTTDPANCGTGTAVLCQGSLFPILTNATPTPSELAAKKGWYLGLVAGEQVVTSAVTIFGVVTFSTHQPAVPQANSCSANLGTTYVYSVGYLNAVGANGTTDANGLTSRYDHLSGDGLPPSPVAGQVRLDDGTVVPFCIGCSPKSPLEGKLPKALTTVVQPKNRLYWYIQK
jgi:type IV pilus assembly protein PilY1